MHRAIVQCAVMITLMGLYGALPAALEAATRAATRDDIEWMRASGIPNPKEGISIDPLDPAVGQEIGEIKLWLAQHATKNVIVSCFEPGFAKKLKTFMEAVPGGPPIITDGYRDPAKQTGLVASGASKAGPCQSYHNYGLAADFNGKANLGWMRTHGPTRFGINVIGAWDPGHFQDNRGRFGQCGACSGGYTGTQQGPGSSSGFPFNMSDRFRNLLGGNNQPSPQPQPAPMPQPPLPQQRNPVQSDQIFGMPTPTPMQPAPGVPLSPKATSTSPADSEPEQASYYSSVTDQLMQLAYDTPLATSSNIATSVPITIDGSDIGTLGTDGRRDRTATTSDTLAYGAPGTVLPSSNTFVSNDLGGGPYQVIASYRGEPTGFISLLVQLRDAFAALLNILRPMGVRDAIHGVDPNDEEMYME